MKREPLKTEIEPMSTFRKNGLLWYINRVAFHPRGFALALDENEAGEITGWQLWYEANGETWCFTPEQDDESFAQFEALLERARKEPQ